MNRRTFITAAAALPVAVATPPAARASVTLDPSRDIGRIHPWLYGHFLEHVERVVYGGVFEPGSKFADQEGMRRDVIDAIKEMGGARIARWPGGNFVSYYRWKDGIGPREKRPRRFDVVWGQQESNQFGTDEYLSLCRKLECDPFITVNMGTGGRDEACEWVEYCRHSKRQPPVKVWGLGNEHFGPWQVGHYTAEEYGHKAQQYGQFMRVVAPDIELVGVGDTSPAWNEGVLRKCGETIDWLTIHLYGHRHFLDGADDYDSTVASPELFYRDMKAMADQLEQYEANSKRKRPIRISLEEWNGRHFKTNAGNSRSPGLVRESPRNIVDALFVAGVFNACHRLASRVAMSNYVFITNAHGPLFVSPEGLVKSAVFDVFRLYATRMQAVAMAADVRAESFAGTVKWSRGEERVTVSRLDVSATRSEDGRRISLALINRHKHDGCRVALDCKGRRIAPGGVLHTLHASDLAAVNTVADPKRVRSTTSELSGLIQSVDLPAHSVNILELSVF
ncbi:MAG TPA: alpha-L-arabinofuranosidase C-terminal domain-containing protein [Bryobacteraceae bacterium]|nr:alpha-L-arabinofuranosidase C-terminal domain-containing protein [Bryobacteraceae bacterium]